jgi:uncharacterized protein YcgI (DUF1989 family)
MSAVTDQLVESALEPADAVLDLTVAPGDGWIGELEAGQHLRIVDLYGNQAVSPRVSVSDDDRPSRRSSCRSGACRPTWHR